MSAKHGATGDSTSIERKSLALELMTDMMWQWEGHSTKTHFTAVSLSSPVSTVITNGNSTVTWTRHDQIW